MFKLSTYITALMAFFLVEASSVFGQAEKHTVRSADGTTIGYTVIGSGSVPVVLVHGTLNTGEQWLQVTETMSEHCTCYVIDRWGRGRSGNRASYSLENEAEDIVAVLEKAGPDAFLLGHSSGAIYAVEAALKAPITGLILYEPSIIALQLALDAPGMVHTWFPQAEDHQVRGVTHSLQMEDPQAVAEGIADFLGRHPLTETSNQ